jgi:hypothetical protein
MKNKKIVFLNKSLNCIIIKKNKNSIYFYNNKFFFFLPFLKIEYILIDKTLNLIIINEKKKFVSNYLYSFLNNFNSVYYKKINFNGKGFKIKKKSKTNFFFFNNSHIKAIIEQKSKIIKNSKNSFLFLFKNIKNYNTLNFLKKLFYLNIFTKKGIKLSRSLMLVKKIKKK